MVAECLVGVFRAEYRTKVGRGGHGNVGRLKVFEDSRHEVGDVAHSRRLEVGYIYDLCIAFAGISHYVEQACPCSWVEGVVSGGGDFDWAIGFFCGRDRGPRKWIYAAKVS